jgi:hypothetical protein
MIAFEKEVRKITLKCDFCKNNFIEIEVEIHQPTEEVIDRYRWKIINEKHCCSTCSK